MKPTEKMSEEHKHILKVVSSLEKECAKLKNGSDINKEFFAKAIDFVRNYADKFHHAKEEDILFVELNKEGVLTHCNPTHQMLHEHDLGREFIKNLETGVTQNDKEKVIENAQGYAQLLKEHIMKEDDILYPMADQSLDEEAQKRLAEQCIAAEAKFEEGTEERYIKLAEELEQQSETS